MAFQCRAHDVTQVIKIERLGDKIEGAGLERGHRGFHVAESGDDGHRQIRKLFLYVAHQVDTVAIGALVAGPLSGWLVQHYLHGAVRPSGMWVILSSIGFSSTLLMVLHDRLAHGRKVA